MALSIFLVICALIIYIAYMKVLYKSFERFQRKLNHEGDILKALHSYKFEVKWSDGNWGLFFGNGQYDIGLCERSTKK